MTHAKTAATILALVWILPAATAAAAGEVTGFTLISARTNEPVGRLKDGATVDRAKTGPVSVRADVAGDVGSVRFEVDGRTVQTESTPPYALAGDNDGNYNAWSVAPGKHTLKATPYAKGGASGKAGKALEITITVKGEGDGGGKRKGRGKPAELQDVAPAETMEAGTVKTSGEMKMWHKVTLAFGGPAASETADPNPFTDYRLLVAFRNGKTKHVVPGYYAADGNAADSGAAAGNVWMVHFAPPATGRWTWKASFRAGKNVAVSGAAEAGEPTAPLTGKTGTFEVGPTDKTGRDFRGRGLLQYVGHRYLRFAETGEWFLKCGADAPENFLAYEDFDNTTDVKGRRKSWKAHVRDWKPGDPTWRGGKGKGIIGALNYLASEGMNVFSFIPITIHGDDKNVFPYVTPDGPFTRLDCSKLAQWEIVFEHADRLGLYLHFKTLETENELLLDGGDLGPERKLYYRELIARFGHHLALNWNLGEEINNASTEQKKAWAAYLWDHDPYHHHIVIHNGANHYDLLGPGSKLTGFSLQTNKPNFENVHRRTRDYIERSVKAGKPWVVACDEPGDASHALRPDADAGDSHEDGRRNGLWGNVMAGGAGTEWYFGYKHAHSDLTCEDFRSRDRWWDYCRYMLEFFDKNEVPFWEMDCDNDLSTADDDYCFAKPGEVYVVYLKHGGRTALDLSGVRGTLAVGWYDPRHGGDLKPGSVRSVAGGGKRDLGAPPNAPREDWVILVRKAGR
ncbi:MAG: DUF5060 domain-containing protein [Phycisphaerae bacterium]